ncbi:hypothetical protein MHK_008489 [Candidatus Magnetomorum sp. HK-1]|nr:hypothetical protein MHK_008489 [Candidatus Magnetomorum sp. HK-1]
MAQSNPKSHDNLFKWLIRSFIYDFFAYFFPNVKVKNCRFIDKEFISKYEALKDSLKGDLFIAAELEIDDQVSEIVIHHENQSNRESLDKRVFEYLCYAWLLKQKPVWSIVFYTDDAVWRKPVPDKYWYGFDSKNEKQFHKFDVIKLKSYMSNELIQKESLLCKLLALKANDKNTDPETLVRKIYQTVSQMKDQLPKDILLLIEQFVSFYKKISQETFERIKKEVNMTEYAESISEYYILEGKKLGEKSGEIKTMLSVIDNLLKKNSVDWSFITSATGIDQQQYFEMQREYQRMEDVKF